LVQNTATGIAKKDKYLVEISGAMLTESTENINIQIINEMPFCVRCDVPVVLLKRLMIEIKAMSQPEPIIK
jgi:hypothetical protein